jgi:chromosome segregation ATPase
MGMMELVDAIGRYGLPTVAAGVVLYLYMRSERRQEERMDRWEARLLGDGNGTRGRLNELRDDLASAKSEMAGVRAEISVVREQTERIAQREDLADAGRLECRRSFSALHAAIADIQTEICDHAERIERIECVTLPDTGTG